MACYWFRSRFREAYTCSQNDGCSCNAHGDKLNVRRFSPRSSMSGSNRAFRQNTSHPNALEVLRLSEVVWSWKSRALAWHINERACLGQLVFTLQLP